MRKQIILIGVLSVVLYLGVTGISKQFNWGEGHAERPIPLYLILYFSLFTLYALAASAILKNPPERGSFPLILIFGLLFRAAILPSQQIQEDDVYRYLWDGKVFAHGMNPYEYAPKEVLDFKKMRITQPGKFASLYDERKARELALLDSLRWANETGVLFLDRVNHPEVPTIYPPLAQYVFRIAHHIRPDSVIFMRLTFLAFDLAAMTFIVLTLAALGKDRNLSLIYFWSPLLIKETFNSTHLDAVGIAALCASLYFLVRVRHMAATLFLALGTLGKFYPVILLPLYLKEIFRNRRAQGFPPWPVIAASLLVFAGTVFIFYLPFARIGGQAFQGLKTFTRHWQSNDSVFALLAYFYKSIAGLDAVNGFFGPDAGGWLSNNLPVLLSKLTVALVLATAVLILLRKRDATEVSPEILLRRIFFLMALVFLLSPVQNPWYLNWLLPFLCLFPSRAWILLTGLIGLYYLDFYFKYHEMRQYSEWLPWLEFAPFYILLALEYRHVPAIPPAAN